MGVISSLVASALIVALSWFSSAMARDWLVRLLSRMTGLGLRRAYSTQKLANQDLPEALENAHWIKVYSGRGNELTRDSFASIWSGGAGKLDYVKILLTEPGSNWLLRRESECAQYDKGFQDGVLSDQVRTNLRYLLSHTKGFANVDIRTCDFPHLCRIIATDKVAFFTPYSATEHGRHQPCYIYNSDSPMYSFVMRVFDSAWADSSPARDVYDDAVKLPG